MNGIRFDALARSLARPTRRGLLGVALGALAAGLTARGGDAAAVPRRPGELCRKGGECASGVCAPDATGRKRCACPGGSAGQCGAACCADCFLERDETGAVTGQICCPAPSVCPGATSARDDDQCCYGDEECLSPGTPCCRSDAIGGCAAEADCAGCCRTCGTDGSGNRICCDQTEECVADPQTGQQTCEPLNTARLSRFRV